ncbi:hypothetical protein GH714_029316 [Hevea brasiliensis]|uniref:Uncharacterized protein n=1 Tax=Hevea brasiliensis TaxID=3981 RepID=A0A6A6KB51_HEVBR|nr:hypothetical protein GH714_029316 [Hevea brasiliensis]
MLSFDALEQYLRSHFRQSAIFWSPDPKGYKRLRLLETTLRHSRQQNLVVVQPQQFIPRRQRSAMEQLQRFSYYPVELLGFGWYGLMGPMLVS